MPVFDKNLTVFIKKKFLPVTRVLKKVARVRSGQILGQVLTQPIPSMDFIMFPEKNYTGNIMFSVCYMYTKITYSIGFIIL